EKIVVINGQPINQKEVQTEFEQAAKGLPEQIKTRVAQTVLVYIGGKDAFTINPTIAGQTAPDPVNIWWAQVQIWVQEDVANAIVDVNTKGVFAGAAGQQTSVLTSPVKRLVKLSVPPNFVTPPRNRNGQ